MSYVNQISGNDIGDDTARIKIDNNDTGLRRDIYHLANVVEAIVRAIQMSEEKQHTPWLTTQEALLKILDMGTSSDTPKKNEAMAASVRQIGRIPNHTKDYYFTDKDGRNIL
jgi:hypothetical protein